MNPIKRAEVIKTPGRTVVKINSSAMGLVHTCERKADYILNQGFGSMDSGSSAQSFGTLVHKTFAEYYQLPKECHNSDTITQIWDKVTQDEVFADPTRTREVGGKALHNYAKEYANDPWRVALIDGLPAVEFPFEKVLFESKLRPLEIRYFGTIDLVVENPETGEIAVMDHKTGKSLGKEFMNRWKPNHQMSGYIWALNTIRPCTKAVINGLQIAKTVQNVCRVETHRTQEELEEFKAQAIKVALRLETGLTEFADGMTCSSYGGCRFVDACATTPSLRGSVLEVLKNKTLEVSDESGSFN